MKAGKVKAVFFIVVFLLMLALIVNWAMGLDASRRQPEDRYDPEPGGDATVIVDGDDGAQPAGQQPANNPSSVPTTPPASAPTPPPPASTPTPAPTPTPQPTPEPTPTPIPAGMSLGSGAVRSDTGTGVNLRCDWTAVTAGDGKAEITLSISADSYALFLGEMTNNVHLRLGDQIANLSQPSLQHEGGATNTPFGSRSFTVSLAPGSNSFPVAIEWDYRGSYGGQQLDVIECGGTITINR